MFELSIDEAIKKCVTVKVDGKQISVNCKLGLWSVSGPPNRAIPEACHYWRQYLGDGEYNELLNQQDQ